MAELAALIEEELARFDVPGAAVAIVADGEPVLVRGFGLRDVDGSLPVTEQTQFQIGSTTKSFTATVLGLLVDEGLLEWDRPVRNYIPGFELMDPLATRQLTLRDMLSHRSGLPGHDMVWMMGGLGEIARGDLVYRLRHLSLSTGFREEWQYSNLMFTAAAYLTEVVGAGTWEEAVAERILEPLGMRDTSFSILELQKSEDRSTPYTERDGVTVEIPLRHEIAAVAPSGAMNSSIADMAKWLLVNVNGGRLGNKDFVSDELLFTLWTPTMLMPEGSLPWPETRVVAYGLGWVVEYFHGRKMVWHNGGIDGAKSMVAVMPEEKLGVVVLSNKFPTMLPEALAHAIFSALLEVPGISWGERFREIELQATEATRDAAPSDESAGALPSRSLDEYAGIYHHPGYGRISFEVAGDELQVELPGLDVTFAHRHHDVWEATERIHGITLPFAFVSDFDGRIDRVEAGLEATVPPIVFTKERDVAGR